MRAGERGLTLALLLHNFFAVGFVTAGRSVRDALFLSRFGSDRLFWMYLASAGSVVLVSLGYAPLAARLRRDLTAQLSALLFAATIGLLWFLSHGGRETGPWIYPALYVAVEVISALLLIQFWTLAGELFHARDARRLFGLIGSGGMIANVVVGLATAKLARTVGSRQVLFLSAILLLGVAAAALGAGHWGRPRLLARAVGRRGRSRQQRVGGLHTLRSGHLRALSLLVVATYFTTTLVDFEFKAVAGRALPVDQLTALFGYISFWVGLVAVGLQLFGTGRLLQRLGVIGALAVLPCTLAMGHLGMAIWPALAMATALKGSDSLFRYSINDATTQILYLPTPSHARAPAKAFIDGVVKPLAIGLAGGALGLYGKFGGPGKGGAQVLAWVGLGLCALWLVRVVSLRSTYLASLRDVLRRPDGRPALSELQEPSAQAALRQALTSANARDVLNALELAPQFNGLDLATQVEALLTHPDDQVRVSALGYLGGREETRYAAAIAARFEDSNADVRAAAITAYCMLGKDKAVRTVTPFLEAAEPEVRGAAVAGMVRFGGLDGILTAAEALKGLIGHPDSRMREHAARVLGEIGVRNFYHPVLELMNDDVPEVRAAAIGAAGALRSPELILPLLYRTPHSREGRSAIVSLAAFGTAVLPVLARALDNRQEEPAVRKGAARVLGKVGQLGALELTLRHLPEPDDEIRGQLFRALIKAGRGHRLSPAQQQQIHQALKLEVQRARETMAAAESLGLEDDRRAPAAGGPREPNALLSSALHESLVQAEWRILTLLTVLYPDAELDLLSLSSRNASDPESSRRRATTVELLDTLLPRALRQEVLPLLEDGLRADRLRAWAAAGHAVPSLSAEAALEALCISPSPWVRTCALYHSVRLGRGAADRRLESATRDPHPLVRETAIRGQAQRAPERAEALARAHLGDDAAPVRAWAQSVLTNRGAGGGSGL